MHFEQPWALALLAAIPPLLWRLRRRDGAALRFSSSEPAADLHQSLRARLVALPFWLRAAALCLLVVALARPQTGGDRTRETGRGIAIQMVIDRSGSMSQGIAYEGRYITRLELAKRVCRQFVTGNGRSLEGRPSDPIGIVAFARRPETVCPLTLAHSSFAGLLASIHPVAERAEDGTAIGDALALAAARLKNAEGEKIKSKVIVLLTDGENNAGVRSVVEAARLVSGWGIRVHAIGIVGAAPKNTSPIYRFNLQKRFASERDLSQLAATCGGIYRSAQDGDSIQSIYTEIDRL